MLNLLANIVPADIVSFARTIPTPEAFELTRRIVPNRQINNVRYKIKSTENRYNAAKFRAYDAETPFGRREVTHQTLEGMLPPVGDKYLIGELEEILLALEHGADDGRLIDAIYDDAERAVRAIRARMELAAGDLLEDGVFELVDENGLTLEADFGVEPAFLPTAPVLWTDAANSKPLDDERAWITLLRTDGDGAPGEVLTSDRVLGLFASNQQYKGAFYGTNTDAANRPTLNPQQVNSVRATYNLPPITTYDATVRVDGANVRPIAESKYILLPSDKASFAETQYGITAEALALSRSGGSGPRIERQDLPGIVVTAREDDDPVRVLTKGSAVAMPVMYAPKAFVSATVTA